MWTFIKRNTDAADRSSSPSQRCETDELGASLCEHAFEAARVGMMISDRDYRLMRVNQAFCDMLGYTRAEFARLRFVDFAYPDDVQRDLAFTEKLFQGELDSYEIQEHYVTKQGRRLLVRLICAVVCDASGQPHCRVAVVEDITQRRLEEELIDRRAEEFRRQAELLDLAHDAILVRDMEGSVIVYWNQGAEAIYGWSKLEALGKISHELLQTRFPKPLAEIEAQVRQRGRWDGDLVHTTRDGRKLVMASRWALQRDARGEPAAILEINSDVTREKRAKKEASRSSEHLRALLEATGDGVFGVDQKGCCTFSNQAGAAMLGYRPEELIGKNMHALAHHTRRDGSPYPDSECPIQQAFRAGKAVRLDNELLWRRDGTPFPAEYSCYPVFEGEETAGAVMVFRSRESGSFYGGSSDGSAHGASWHGE
jgi:PAS domain S-box-containing protein